MEQRSGLYRSRKDSIIGGVAGGIAESLNIDPIIIRIIFIVFCILWGSGFLIYAVLWIALPIEDDVKINYSTMEDESKKNKDKMVDHEISKDPVYKSKNDGNLIAGLILIALGIIFLIIRFVPRIDFGDLWPIILLAAGVAMIWRGFKRK